MHPIAIVIKWLGQACFLLTLPHGKVLLDPVNPKLGYAVSAHSIPADTVFVSHEHFDHNYVEAAVKPSQVIQPLSTPNPAVVSGAIPQDGVTYKRIFAYHDNTRGSQRGTDTITKIDADGLSIVHMGDIGELTLTPAQVAAIGHVDVLMIPVGGFFTVDGSQAAKIVSQLRPRVIIPMHYGTPALPADLQSKLAPATPFLTAMRGKATVTTVKARDLTLSKATLPKKTMIYLLRYQ